MASDRLGAWTSKNLSAVICPSVIFRVIAPPAVPTCNCAV